MSLKSFRFALTSIVIIVFTTHVCFVTYLVYLLQCLQPQVANVWYSVNGERLGTYNGHTGAVWCVDCDCILYKKYTAICCFITVDIVSVCSFVS